MTVTTQKSVPFIDLQTQQSKIRHLIDQRLGNVLRHGQYILGPEVAELETALAKYVGVQHCIAVSSGTDALLLALMALGIGAGDGINSTQPLTIGRRQMGNNFLGSISNVQIFNRALSGSEVAQDFSYRRSQHGL